jgi:DNA-binding YbaB/EbfC family protein
MADLSQILQLSQQVQGRLQQLQADLADRLVEASAGGGLVKVKADGRGQIRELVIDPQAFEGRDAELLADLVLSAVAEAQRRAADAAQAEVRKAQSLPFPPGL